MQRRWAEEECKTWPMVHFNSKKDDIQLVHISEYILQGLEWDGAIQMSDIKMTGFFWLSVFSLQNYSYNK